MRLETQKKYLEMYQMHLRKRSQVEIAEEMGCTSRTVRNALRFYREKVLRATKAEELQEALDTIKSNLREMYQRLEEIQEGYKETTTRENTEGTETVIRHRHALNAEMTLRREIREYEKLLFTYQGLLNLVNKGEQDDSQIVIKFPE